MKEGEFLRLKLAAAIPPPPVEAGGAAGPQVPLVSRQLVFKPGRSPRIGSRSWWRRRRPLAIVPDTTSSFVTFWDITYEVTWTVPVVGWNKTGRTAVVVDIVTGELVRVETMYEGEERVAFVWSQSMVYEDRPMSMRRVEAMLAGYGDEDG